VRQLAGIFIIHANLRVHICALDVGMNANVFTPAQLKEKQARIKEQLKELETQAAQEL